MPRMQSLKAKKAPRRAEEHHATRKAHATERAEDYVETVGDLIERMGEARVTDIARELGVSHVSVTRMVARLRDAGLVTAEPYRSIFLTPAGARLAQAAKRRHETVVRFLIALGVSDQAARIDAEGLEHHVGEETLRAFERFLKRTRS